MTRIASLILDRSIALHSFRHGPGSNCSAKRVPITTSIYATFLAFRYF